ncbi:hypothetical protein GU926_17025 [Nibribacter ruber]|uniref:Uncharacterized protein n=1 Tax=Nibribacter ruber TaxID=2698458 RepID=A0A6P1P3X0_9BACT|nr:hypothetical protein [Nibribacter ruber]QHL89036.1 hypothetical protein GU926_17025 [Nibribacter ruber]
MADQFEVFVKSKIDQFGSHDYLRQFTVSVQGNDFVFLYEYLPWDSDYFKRNCFKLFTVLFVTQNATALVEAIFLFKQKLQEVENVYCFMEIPTEDIFLLQCLNEAGLKLVETRFHYFKKNLAAFEGPRYSVRKANAEDSAMVAKIAAENRNAYDRLHADHAFSEQEADEYLGTYAAAAVNGFCHQVLVPNVPNLPVASFIAYDHYRKISPKHTVSLVYARLAAVSPENRGWYVKLLTEVIHAAKEEQATYLKITTQSTNKAVIKTFESLGCNFGATTHILSFNR